MSVRLPRVIGHRGAAGHAPENTLASLRLAGEQGATWVEFDVMLTADKVPVLFHDDSLLRTTGVDRLMAETPHADLAGLDAGSNFDAAFAGEPIPTLAEALTLLLDLGLHPDIEFKPTPGCDVETAVRTVEVTAEIWPDDRPAPYFCSFSPMALAAQRALRPDWPAALNALQVAADWQTSMQSLGCCSYHLVEREITPSLVRQVHEAGYLLAAFTVNEPAQARQLLDWGVEAIVTDKPGALLAALDG